MPQTNVDIKEEIIGARNSSSKQKGIQRVGKKKLVMENRHRSYMHFEG